VGGDDRYAPITQEGPRIRQALLPGTDKPLPVRRGEIPNPDGGGKWPLGIPTGRDRLIPQALHQVLPPICAPDWSISSHGFRPVHRATAAVERARRPIEEGNAWVVDSDLESYCDRVHHDLLRARVARKVQDKRVRRR